MPRKPLFCAKEGDVCSCPAGRKVFFGAASTEKNVNATFQEVVDQSYSYGFSPKKGEMKCSLDNFNDPLEGQTKKCFCDVDDYYHQEWIDEDFKELAAKKEQEEEEAKAKELEAKRKALEAEAKRVAAEAKAAQERADKERIKKIQEARAAADKARDEAEAEAKKLRDAARERQKKEQEAAQKAELESDEAEHQAELDRLAAIAAEQEAENAKDVDRAKKRLEAHAKRVEAENRKREAEERKRRA